MKKVIRFLKYHFEDPNLFRLILLVAASATLIIVINFYTIRIMSSVRAYIYGESQYSKGEKDAAQNLILFLNTEESKYYNAFLKNIQIPQGDSLAREKLSANAPSNEVRSGFLKGMNDPADIDNLIWLFRHFKRMPLMKIPIENWKKGDSLIYQKYLIGNRVNRLIESDHSNEQKNILLKEILENSNQLTLRERAFSESLGRSSRQVGSYLLFFNIVFTVLVFINTNAYASRVFSKLSIQNTELMATNLELDKFVYSASHDLRAPISSLKGLVAISKMEKDPEALQHYLALMEKTLDKQDMFIKDIIDFSRNKKLKIAWEEIDLSKLIDESIDEHVYMPGAERIKINKDYQVQIIFSDSKRLSIVINNLISNAIKYLDPDKCENKLSIKTSLENHSVFIELEDNGIGIDEKNQPHIFNMFFVATANPKGTGLGLYITKETVDKLGGQITISSELMKGTRFTIQLPNKKELHP